MEEMDTQGNILLFTSVCKDGKMFCIVLEKGR
ncbi:hypothetical protein Mucpa_4035 [Mucilaginibacter paludis DSM 18603]|uniref:Uncharacterized protein n=1 Tax=Mucilaginibacter paludis DSM 18603 TaxID=714943 RepID=H1Y4T2_9SPHI|nr:hypothetical protein Mucpa_4035 [Mucilaginibacter paludis DSM 18603]